MIICKKAVSGRVCGWGETPQQAYDNYLHNFSVIYGGAHGSSADSCVFYKTTVIKVVPTLLEVKNETPQST